MESSSITPRPPTAAVSQVRETGERQPGRRRFDEERRKAFRRRHVEEEGENPDAELRLSQDARKAEARHEDESPREVDVEDSVHDVRGRRLDIRI